MSKLYVDEIHPKTTGGTINLTNAVHIDQFRMPSHWTTDGNSLINTWERPTESEHATVGDNVSHSTGIFTLPLTGVWRIDLHGSFRTDTSDNINVTIEVTTNNSSYTIRARALSGGDSAHDTGAYATYLFNCTNVTTHKVRVRALGLDASSYIMGDGTAIYTGITFTRLANAQ